MTIKHPPSTPTPIEPYRVATATNVDEPTASGFLRGGVLIDPATPINPRLGSTAADVDERAAWLKLALDLAESAIRGRLHDLAEDLPVNVVDVNGAMMMFDAFRARVEAEIAEARMAVS